MIKNILTLLFCTLVCLTISHARADTPSTGFLPNAVYASPKAPAEARVSDLLARLTQPEKLSLLALIGYGDPYKLDLPAIPRLGIPSLRTIDSTVGLRDGPASAFPMEVVLASSWNPELVRQVGAAVGQEARAKNRQIVYGPCVNIQRTPQGGRYFENFSEDPYINAQMATAYVDGMQSQCVASCIKHYLCNDQETDRHDIDVAVDERTLHEIYLPAFDAAVHQAHVWALMPALGRVNGEFCAQNKPLLGDLLETQWGWDGLAVSDWGSVHTTAETLIAGTDVEMPQPDHFSPTALTNALAGGQITQGEIDDAVRRVLRLMLRTGLLGPAHPVPQSVVNSPAHQALARKAALEGITLLKNTNHFLPLPKSLKSLAVIGPNASDTQLGGRWSADVKPFYQVSVLEGIQKKLGPNTTVLFTQGCPRTGASAPGEIEKAAALARAADAAIVVVGTDNTYEGEEMDPPDLHLPGDQEKLIQAVAAANPHTLVVLNCGTPLLVSRWLSRVPGLLETWYSGQEAGHAAADIIFGDACPSGKLAGSWANARDEFSDWGNYPGAGGFVRYTEGVYVGYRHFDKEKIKPLFPFGYGLSYTTFAYRRLEAPGRVSIGQPTTVRVSVQNTGKRTGEEIVECYVRPLAPKIDRPVRELKAFARVPLLPGQTKSVMLTLGPEAFAFWNTKTHGWTTDPGAYALDIGASSRDIRLSATLHLGYTEAETQISRIARGGTPVLQKCKSPPARAEDKLPGINSSPAQAGACALKPCRSGQGTLLLRLNPMPKPYKPAAKPFSAKPFSAKPSAAKPPAAKGTAKKPYTAKPAKAAAPKPVTVAAEPEIAEELPLFADLALSEPVMRAINDLGFEAPTPIQARSIPVLLAGRDLIGQAQTGTGKTAAFALPLIEGCDPANPAVQALVLEPTRELAIQVAGGILALAKHTGLRVVPVYGGQPLDRQFRALREGAHIVVGTPGRLLDHLRRGTLVVDQVKVCVLDEADEMLALGFLEDMETILAQLPEPRQLAFFSATMPPRIAALTQRFLKDPVHVAIDAKRRTVAATNQTYYEVAPGRKLEALARVLDMETPGPTIVFCRTRQETNDLADALRLRGYSAEALHGDLGQADRDRVMRRFREGLADLLIATDVAARGLDIDTVTHVINYDIPWDVEQYIHRIGRTGRAGRTGDAITLVEGRERRQLRAIEQMTGATIKPARIPTAADIAARRRDLFQESLRETLAARNFDGHLAAVEALSEEYDPGEIAAAALQMLWTSQHSGPAEAEEELNAASEQPEVGMARLFIGLGRQDGLRPGDLVGAISNEAGLTGRSIGAIDILDRTAFVEVPAPEAQNVVAVLRRATIRGRKVKVELAAPALSRPERPKFRR